MIKVCKFGGTSMADSNALKKVKDIIESDDTRRYIVVSAPGKRFPTDKKVTDLLYACYDELVKEGSCKNSFTAVRDRFSCMVNELGLSINIKEILDKTEKEIDENKSKDFTASRGEYLSAQIIASYLGYEFVDATEFVIFDSQGKLNEEYTNDKVSIKIAGKERVVMPGFYGKDAFGAVKTFSRGGSDITGSIVARGVKADVYENWTDVSGFLVCDPRIVPYAKAIKQLTYKELRELSYMGAEVLHPEAIFPVMKGKIKINIKNTFAPNDCGTMIVPNEQYVAEESTIITGISGKKNFTIIFIEKSMMNSEVGFVRKVLSVIEHYGLCIEHLPSGIDTLSVVIESSQLKNGILTDIVNDIRDSVSPDYIHVIENISLVATVGHGMTRRPGTAATLFNALAKAGINVRLIDQGSSELNIIIGIANSDYEKCIQTIYDAFEGTK